MSKEQTATHCAGQVPEGWQSDTHRLVPIEPTDAQELAGSVSYYDGAGARDIYCAMVAAAPQEQEKTAAGFMRINKGGSGEFISINWHVPQSDIPDHGVLYFSPQESTQPVQPVNTKHERVQESAVCERVGISDAMRTLVVEGQELDGDQSAHPDTCGNTPYDEGKFSVESAQADAQAVRDAKSDHCPECNGGPTTWKCDCTPMFVPASLGATNTQVVPITDAQIKEMIRQLDDCETFDTDGVTDAAVAIVRTLYARPADSSTERQAGYLEGLKKTSDPLDVETILNTAWQFFSKKESPFAGGGTIVQGGIGSLIEFAHTIRALKTEVSK